MRAVMFLSGAVCLALAACATPTPSSSSLPAVTPLVATPLNAAMIDVFDGAALRVILCGTSAPLPDPARAKACTVVIAGDKAYVIDTGPESWEQLARMQFPGVRIAGVFITHFHSDHIGDLGEFRMQTMAAGRAALLPVYGPVGVKRIVDGFNMAYDQDAQLRLAHHGAGLIKIETAALVAHEFGKAFTGDHTGEQVILEQDGLKVTAFEVDHDPVRPAVGYRFDWKGRSVVISGDMALSPNLTENAKGADVLISESIAVNLVSTMQTVVTAQGNVRIGKIFADIPDYHATPVEAAQMANDAGVGLLVYSHYIPSNQASNPAYFAGVAAVRPADKWVAGYDGFRVDLPVGSKDIKQSGLLPKPN